MKISSFLVLSAVIFAMTADARAVQDDDRTFFVSVAKGTELEGQIVDIPELKVTTSFGEVTIPVEKIEAVKMHADNEDSAIIVFTNGDVVTGKIEIDELNLKTTWGKAMINAESVESISSSRYGRFYSDPQGGGWRFAKGSANPGGGNAINNNTFNNQGNNLQQSPPPGVRIGN